MAEYQSATRTNYFHVTDPDALRDLLNETHCDNEKTIELFTRGGKTAGETLYGFGCLGEIDGLPCGKNSELEEYALAPFHERLQELLAPGDAILIMASGHEKLREVCASAWVITKETVRYIDMWKAAVDTARALLGNEQYNTFVSY